MTGKLPTENENIDHWSEPILLKRIQDLEASNQELRLQIEELIEAKTAAEQTAVKLTLLQEKAYEGIVLIGKDGKMSYASPAAKRFFGYTASDTDFPNPVESTHPEDIPMVLSTINSILSNPSLVSTIEYRFRTKNGKWIWIESTFSNHYSLLGLESLVINFKDISGRKEIEESLLFNQFALDQMSDAAYWVNHDGKFKYVNHAACRLLGYGREEMVQMSIYDIATNERALYWPTHWEELKKAGHLFFMTEHKSKAGILVPVEINANFISFGGKEYNCAFVRDISERKLAERALKESEEKYRMLAENMKDVIWTLDTESLRFLYISPSVFQLRGYTPEEIMGETMDTVLIPQQRDIVRKFLTERKNDLLNGKITFKNYFIEEIEQPCKNGSTVWTEVITYFWENPLTNKVEVHGVTRDISERKRAEQLIFESEARLRELNVTKDKFFSIIAHDLKNPFQAIIGFSDLLLDQVREKDYEGIEEYAGIVQSSSHRAMSLLSSLLDWSRMQTGKMEFIPRYHGIISLVNNITELAIDSANQKSISILKEFSHDFRVFADKDMISSVIRNLISNAIKFTHPGGKIIISAGQKQNETWVSVTDNGVGIKEGDIENLFRIDKSHTTPGTQNEMGTGIGLLLCKEFIEKHGGQITVESGMGKGSTFTFTIPKL